MNFGERCVRVEGSWPHRRDIDWGDLKRSRDVRGVEKACRDPQVDGALLKSGEQPFTKPPCESGRYPIRLFPTKSMTSLAHVSVPVAVEPPSFRFVERIKLKK